MSIRFGTKACAAIVTSVSERACCFQLGLRLRAMIERYWDVDLEYNRQGEDTEVRKKGTTGGGARMPDLIIHNRGKKGPENNLLCLELKTQLANGAIGRPEDIEGLRHLVKTHEYKYGCLLNLNIQHIEEGVPSIQPKWYWVDSCSDALGRKENTRDVYKPPTLKKVMLRAKVSYEAK